MVLAPMMLAVIGLSSFYGVCVKGTGSKNHVSLVHYHIPSIWSSVCAVVWTWNISHRFVFWTLAPQMVALLETLWSLQKVWPSWRKRVTRSQTLKATAQHLVPISLFPGLLWCEQPLPWASATTDRVTLPWLPRCGTAKNNPSSLEIFL